MDSASNDNGEAGNNEEDGEDNFPGDVVVENVLGSEEEDDAG